MQLNLTGKNLKITPAIKTHTEDKFDHLHKRYSQINSIHVILHIENIDHYAEATVHFHGSELHASAKASDMYLAIDALVENLSGQMHKQKEKSIDSQRHHS